MSHLHLPDGVIPPLWIILGFIVTAILLAPAVWELRGEEARVQVPRVGITSAFMLLAMGVPLGLLPLHLNLAVLAGILLGPRAGLLAVFIVNLILALMGHGGITAVGLNTLVVGSEAVLGYYLFSVFKRKIRAGAAAAAATVVALAFSLSLMIGLVGLTQVDPATLVYHDSHETEHPAAGHQHEGFPALSLSQFAQIVFSLGSAGIAAEAAVTSLVVGYLLKVRPGLIFEQKSADSQVEDGKS
ncbi:MAG: energy-coupling factor ABC transporter permease [Thermoanaerobacteraceae bacterium]|nr:energy-coupling factor ABC transporter permease [Thermoanaerobacteraceae bacterium]